MSVDLDPGRPPDGGPGLGQLRTMFRDFAASTVRAPLYARLAAGIADDDELVTLLLHAPAPQRQPVLLFACVHDLLLAGRDQELAAWFPNLTDPPADGDPLPALRRFCSEHRDELCRALSTRSTQTNEIGRCAILLPALGLLAAEVGALAHLDVGASAGLNLLLDRYAYRYQPGGDVGAPSPVLLGCGTRGPVPVPAAPPAIAARAGLDRSPIDITDPVATRWLEACVWPDQRDRFERLRAALAIARHAGIVVGRGDAVDDVATTAAELGEHGHPVITNTWVLNYLTPSEQIAYLAALDGLGRARDVSWVYLESPRLIPALPVPADEAVRDASVLTVVRWRAGDRTVEHVATAHPHGYWLHWGIGSAT